MIGQGLYRCGRTGSLRDTCSSKQTVCRQSSALIGAKGECDKRKWIAAELAAIALVLVACLCGLEWIALRWHVLAMLVGECFTGFFAVWTVHHGCDAHEPGRTQRGAWLTAFFIFDVFPCGASSLSSRADAAFERTCGET